MKKTRSEQREYYLRKRYGITTADYNDLLRKQRQRCPICLRSFKAIPRQPHVDHNHKTGELRGVLCGYCNHRVVGRHTDAELLRRVADYLEIHTGMFVPERKRKKRWKRKTTTSTV